VKKNLVLLGMMAAGKSSLGHIVAKKLKLQFIDVDKYIEKKNSMKISQIFKQKGEKFFRNEEETESLSALDKKNCVISLGGGAFLNQTIREKVLKKSLSVWLDVNIKILNERIKSNSKRPLLGKENNLEKLENLYKERKNIYKLANHRILCDKHKKSNIIDKIIALYEKQ